MREKRKAPDFWLFLTAFILLCVGLLMVYSSSGYSMMVHLDDSLHYFKRQLLWALIALAIMRIVMMYNYWLYKKQALFFLCVSFILLVLVLLIGEDVKGATRQIDLKAISFSPAEFVKIFLVIVVASSLSGMGERIKDFSKGVFPSVLLVSLIAGLVLMQPDLGTAASMIIIVFIMIFAAGARMLHIFITMLTGMTAVALAVMIEPYRMSRYLSFIDPWKDPLGDGFQTVQGLYALGSGGLFGVGLGQSKQKLLYLPENHTDFIFAIIGEELGFIGVSIVLLLFAMLIWRGLKIAMNSDDTFASLLATGITACIGVQVLINIAMVVGAMPVTGIPLPFISFGGTSLVATMIGVGILLNISKYTSSR